MFEFKGYCQSIWNDICVNYVKWNELTLASCAHLVVLFGGVGCTPPSDSGLLLWILLCKCCCWFNTILASDNIGVLHAVHSNFIQVNPWKSAVLLACCTQPNSFFALRTWSPVLCTPFNRSVASKFFSKGLVFRSICVTVELTAFFIRLVKPNCLWTISILATLTLDWYKEKTLGFKSRFRYSLLRSWSLSDLFAS